MPITRALFALPDGDGKSNSTARARLVYRAEALGDTETGLSVSVKFMLTGPLAPVQPIRSHQGRCGSYDGDVRGEPARCLVRRCAGRTCGESRRLRAGSRHDWAKAQRPVSALNTAPMDNYLRCVATRAGRQAWPCPLAADRSLMSAQKHRPCEKEPLPAADLRMRAEVVELFRCLDAFDDDAHAEFAGRASR